MTAILDRTSTAEDSVRFLWLELTGRCQLECVHCYADSSPRGTDGTMLIEDWIRVIDQAADAGVTAVQFIGGEPTLYSGLPDLIVHALNRELTAEVFTNLVHVTDELWSLFARPGVSLATSYYSDDAQQHQAITGRPTHARTKANIAKAIARGISIRTGIIDIEDGQRVAQAHDELVDLGVPQIGYDRLREVGRGGRDRDIDQAAAQLCGQCGNGAAAITPDGKVRPCIMSRWMEVGDVRSTDLAAALTALPHARKTLVAQGMPNRAAANCNPQCAPSGGNCYPLNCPPRW